jgi:hypothetical protein
MMLWIFLGFAILAAALIFAWNFVPSISERFKGWTTILDTVVSTTLLYVGLFTDGLQEAYRAGYIPKDWYLWVPLILAVGIILKRLRTKTPVGTSTPIGTQPVSKQP